MPKLISIEYARPKGKTQKAMAWVHISWGADDEMVVPLGKTPLPVQINWNQILKKANKVLRTTGKKLHKATVI